MQHSLHASAGLPRLAAAYFLMRAHVANFVRFRAAPPRKGFKGFNIFAMPPLGGDVAKSRRYGLLA